MLYFDVVEFGGGVGIVNIKLYYNVGGFLDDFDFELIELLWVLFKDEVCVIGCEFGIFEVIVGC